MLQNTNRPPSAKGKAAVINAWRPDYSHKTDADAIALAWGLRPVGRDRWQGVCPACGYRQSLSLTVSDGKPLWYCHACQDSAAITAALCGGVRMRGAPAIQKRVKPASPDKLAYAHTRWRESVFIADTVAAGYLAGRGLHGLYPDALRFLPACWHTPTATCHPAMIAAVRRWPSQEVVAVHRTFIKTDGSGKIDHPQARMLLGDATGGAVQLAPATERLGLAEGIETALSVLQKMGFPVWACLSTAGLQNVALPDTVREVVICADHDRNGAGQRAAHTAAERLHHLGKRVRIALPPQADSDFNDMLQGDRHD